MKRALLVILSALLMMVFFANNSGATWFRGTIHHHSTYSDGDRTPAMLKNAVEKLGFKYVIVTDHINSIPKEKKDIRTDLFSDDYGFDKYQKDYSSATPILCLAGAEITSSQGSHILAIPDKVNIFDTEWAGQDQQVILNNLNSLGAISIAAHPSVNAYALDKSKATGLTCVEVFNESATLGKKTLNWILDQVAFGEKPVLIAGNDSHTSVDPTDYSRWQRATFVWTDDPLTKASLMRALRDGRTYASAYGAYLSSINVLPGNKYQDIDIPKFKLVFGLQSSATSEKTVRVYRDGILVQESVNKFPRGKKSYAYEWEDVEATKGNHVYIIEVEGCLLTSPICLTRKSLVDSTVSSTPTIPTPAPEKNTPSFYKDAIDERIKDGLRKRWEDPDTRMRFMVDAEDDRCLTSGDIDKRVAKILADLVKNDHDLAVRIRSGYTGQNNISRESDPGWKNISAHSRSMAFDIFWIDGVEIAWQVGSDPVKRQKAQAKIRQVLKEVLNIGGTGYYLPTQIFVYQREDIMLFSAEAKKQYGGYPPDTGLKGMMSGARYWDRIHIGY